MDVLKIIMISFKAWPSWLSSCGYFQRGERSFKCELGYTSTSSVLRERRALFAWNFAILYLWLNTPPLLLWWYIPLSVNSHCVIPLICVTVCLSHEGNDVTKQSVSFCQTKKKDGRTRKKDYTYTILVTSCLRTLSRMEVPEEQRRHSAECASLCVVCVTSLCVCTCHSWRHFALSSLRVRATPVVAHRLVVSTDLTIKSPMPD